MIRFPYSPVDCERKPYIVDGLRPPTEVPEHTPYTNVWHWAALLGEASSKAEPPTYVL
jgi:hypothetical protein